MRGVFILSDKVTLAKTLGLEKVMFMSFDCDDEYPLTCEFSVNGRYFCVDAKSDDEAWELAADKFITDLTAVSTISYNQFSYWS
jgi:hypothetical protein